MAAQGTKFYREKGYKNLNLWLDPEVFRALLAYKHTLEMDLEQTVSWAETIERLIGQAGVG